MDEYHEKQRSSYSYRIRIRNGHFIKWTLQFVSSVALLSYFLCHSTYYSGFSLFPHSHSFSVYFSTFLFSFFTHTLERKYMFLICNGILAFLAKTSSVSSDSELGGTSSINSIPKKPSFIGDNKGEEPEYDVEGHQREEEENYYESLSRIQVEEEEEERESEVSVIVEDDDDEESDCPVRQEEGTGGAANEEIVSTEELNRKFEEFIRKMKEEIRIEGQQQLIAM